MCLIINKTNRCIEKSNGNEYLTLFPTDDSEDKLKKYDKLWNKLRDLIRLIRNNSEKHSERSMKSKYNSDDDIHLKDARTL